MSGDLAGPATDTGYGLLLGAGLCLSFQRYPLPRDGLIQQVPSSLGALPVGRWGGGTYLPLEADEAFWIGIGNDADPVELSMAATGRIGAAPVTFDLLSGTSPRRLQARRVGSSSLHVAGIPLPNGAFRSLARTAAREAPALRSLAFTWRRRHYPTETLVMHLCDYSEFRWVTGRPPPDPLDRTAGYGGWLLP